MGRTIFSQSDNFKSEYSCAVVRIGELTPVEGSDFLAKTNVLGTQIVVRRDQCKTGDLVLYAANETQLNERFLSVNNLYEIGCREKNANYEEVEAIMKPYLDTKPEIEKLRTNAKSVKSSIDGLNKKAAKYNKTVKKLEKELASLTEDDPKRDELRSQITSTQEIAGIAYKKALSKTTVYAGLKNNIEEMVKVGEPMVAEAKKHCGFFNKYGRVRCIVLRNEPSFGFLFALAELQKFCPNVTEEDLISYEGKEFDTVDGELFVKAYIPPVKTDNKRKERTSKAQKKVERFDRMVEGELYFHYDTTQLQKNMRCINPDDVVTISNKIHGTSCIFGNLKVKTPKKIALYKRLVNSLWKTFGKKKPYIDYDITYGPVFTSRTVIKNQYLNKDVNSGFYKVDLWSHWGEIIYPYLEPGMTVYGEIFGYLPTEEGSTYIQKMYDYGCEPGQSKLMLYRITTTTDDSKFEWEVREVREYTERLIERMKANNDPNAENIHPIDILYHGTLANLYPDIDTETHWHEEVLNRLKKDKVHFGMEMNEPMCKNEVPREGICLRKFNDPINECFKLKTISFALREASEVDAGYVDIEVSEGNYLPNEDNATEEVES